MIRVEVFNAAGAPVGINRELDIDREAMLSLDTAYLPTGVYFAVVQTEQERVVVSFVKN